MTDSSGSKAFKRTGVGVTAPVLSDGQAQYSGLGSESRGGVKTYFHSALKNTDVQTNSAQTQTASRVYDAFGNVVSSTGMWKSPFGNAGKFGYQEDPGSGLKLLGQRYYDSSTGRFLTRDPIKDGRNWYSYCDNSPVNAIDAVGLKKIVIALGKDKDKDITGWVKDIVEDIKDAHPNDEIVIVDNQEDFDREIADADELIYIGHYDPIMENEWTPIMSSIDLRDGEGRIDPHEISKIRKGKRLDKVSLIGCNTLTNPASAAAWSRICNGNLYGTTYLLNIKYYAWGWSGMPGGRLIIYDPDWRPTRMPFTGKKGKGIGFGF